MTLENRVSLLDLVNTTNEVVETVDNEVSNILYKTSNVVKYGSIIDNNGVISGFDTNIYTTLPQLFNPGNKSWEIKLKIKVGLIESGMEQIIFATTFSNTNNKRYGTRIYINTDGNWYTNIGLDSEWWDYIPTTILAQQNTTYYLKYSFDLTKYSFGISTDNINYTTFTVDSTAVINPTEFAYLGYWTNYLQHQPYFKGEIDLNECYINIDGKRFWSGTQNTSSNGLSNIDLSNLSSNGKSVITNNAWPSTTYTDLVPTSTAQYKAPADSWFVVGVDTGNSSGNVILFNATKNIANEVHVPSNYTGCGNINIMASKNDMVTLYYPGTPRYFKFIYAEGSK